MDELSQTAGLAAATSGMHAGLGTAPRIAESQLVEPSPEEETELCRVAHGTVSENTGGRP